MRMGGASARGYARHKLGVREVLVDRAHLLGVLAVPPGLALAPVRLRKVLGIRAAESLELSPVPWLARYSHPLFPGRSAATGVSGPTP